MNKSPGSLEQVFLSSKVSNLTETFWLNVVKITNNNYNKKTKIKILQ